MRATSQPLMPGTFVAVPHPFEDVLLFGFIVDNSRNLVIVSARTGASGNQLIDYPRNHVVPIPDLPDEKYVRR